MAKKQPAGSESTGRIKPIPLTLLRRQVAICKGLLASIETSIGEIAKLGAAEVEMDGAKKLVNAGNALKSSLKNINNGLTDLQQHLAMDDDSE